jgi:hypothetical protein
MRVRLIGHQGEPFMNTGSEGPWYEFAKELKSKGCEMVQDDFGIQIDLLISNTHSKKGLKEAKKSKLDQNKKHLILWEPPIIDYKRHQESTLKKYGIIWSPTIYWAIRKNTRIFKWPQLLLKQQDESLEKWTLRENKSVMVLANKFSAAKGELYSLRRELGKKTAKNCIMDLYGDKWNLNRMYSFRHYLENLIRTPIWKISLKSWRYLGSQMKNYKGLSRDKTETCRKYRIVVVLENSKDYISEKFFDAFESGAIVIYVGPPLNDFGIPNESAILVEPNVNSILKKITEILNLETHEQYEISRKQQKHILSVSSDWYCNIVLKKLAHDIYLASINPIKH